MISPLLRSTTMRGMTLADWGSGVSGTTVGGRLSRSNPGRRGHESSREAACRCGQEDPGGSEVTQVSGGGAPPETPAPISRKLRAFCVCSTLQAIVTRKLK